MRQGKKPTPPLEPCTDLTLQKLRPTNILVLLTAVVPNVSPTGKGHLLEGPRVTQQKAFRS